MIKLASLFRCVLLLGGAKRYENEKWIKDLSKDMVSILFFYTISVFQVFVWLKRYVCTYICTCTYKYKYIHT